MLSKAMRFSAAAAILLACCASILARPLLGPGERMVFLGDSITEQRIHTRYVMDFFALRYPGAKISFRNAGWSGDTAPGGLNRLERDVLSLKPNVVSICFGMNDGGYNTFDKPRYEAYMNGMSGLVSSMKKAGVKVVLLTPGCVDSDRPCGWVTPDNMRAYNSTLELYAKGVKELAERENLPVYDLHSLMMDVQSRAKADYPQFTMIPDGVHPSPPGQMVMAYALLKALGVDEQPSGLAVDVKNGSFTADRCKISGLMVTDYIVNFTRADDALPMFLDPEAKPTSRYLPFNREMNRYQFKVTGLKAGSWKLKVRGKEVGTYNADDLAVGVDLAGAPGPWQDLAKRVDDLSRAQETYYFTRWRNVSLDWVPEDANREQQALLSKLDKLTDQKEAERINAASDRTWQWSLTFVQ